MVNGDARPHLPARSVARLLCVKTATLRRWRWEGRGPMPYVRISNTLVVYPAEAVERFLRERTITKE